MSFTAKPVGKKPEQLTADEEQHEKAEKTITKSHADTENREQRNFEEPQTF